MYGVIQSEPVKDYSSQDILDLSLARVSPDAKVGQTVEFTMLRAGKNECADCVKKGHLNWVPTYRPTVHPLKD